MSVILLNQAIQNQITYTNTFYKSENNQHLFGYCISGLEFIQYIHQVNGLQSSLGCNTRINTKVFYTAIKYVLTQKPFTPKLLKAYLKELKKVEAFKHQFSKLFNVEHIGFNYNAESLLLGLPLAVVVNPPQCIDDLGELRFNVLYDFYAGKVGVKNTIRGLRVYRDKVLKYL